MTSSQSWDEGAADIIARDGDQEEPPAYVSGHDAFLDGEVQYQGFADPELCDE